jgi:rhodanese-related sulfurtransferase
VAATIAREQLRAKIDSGADFVLIDVLSPESYARRHLPGAVNIPLSALDAGTTRLLDKQRETVVYCASFEGQASVVAAQRLEELGFKRVLEFAGGVADWEDAGYPFEP